MSTDELPKKAVQALRLRLQHVKNHLEPIFSKPLNDISAKLTMTEKYELQVLLSYSLNTLFYIYLRINGSDPQKHAVMTELKRVQKYITKLKTYQGKEDKPNMKLNKEAAGRFIKAAISTNQEESSRSSQSKKKREIINVYSSSEDEEKTKPAKKKGRVMMDPFSGDSKGK